MDITRVKIQTEIAVGVPFTGDDIMEVIEQIARIMAKLGKDKQFLVGPTSWHIEEEQK